MSNRKMTTESFISRAKEIHGDKYDYSLTVYDGANFLVKIGCPVHGFFEQRASNHLNKNGCRKCFNDRDSQEKKYSFKEFLRKAQEVHHNKYEYPDTGSYDGATKLVSINCSTHGSFLQCGAAHLQGQGCPFCATEARAKANTLTHEEFVAKARAVHSSKYTYPTTFVSVRDKIDIICPIHGMFVQLANNHLQGQGCPECGFQILAEDLRLAPEEFLRRAREVHNDKYTYLSVYVDSYTKVQISCPHHGNFEQLPPNHMGGQGCPQCMHYISAPETLWLDQLMIPHCQRQQTILLGTKTIRVDGYDPNTNTIYEFHGDYWHGNPEKFDPNDMNERARITFGELYARTMNREELIKSAGYNLITMWESQFKQINKGILK